MHTLSPPIAHRNLKAANIMLDDELKPRVCDGGLSILKPLTSNNVKVKVNVVILHVQELNDTDTNFEKFGIHLRGPYFALVSQLFLTSKNIYACTSQVCSIV